jgi:hypothetical protein
MVITAAIPQYPTQPSWLASSLSGLRTGNSPAFMTFAVELALRLVH